MLKGETSLSLDFEHADDAVHALSDHRAEGQHSFLILSLIRDCDQLSERRDEDAEFQTDDMTGMTKRISQFFDQSISTRA